MRTILDLYSKSKGILEDNTVSKNSFSIKGGDLTIKRLSSKD